MLTPSANLGTGTGLHVLCTPACSLGGCEAYRSGPGTQHPKPLSPLASGVWAFLPTGGAALTLQVLGTCASCTPHRG